ncbi:GNAT family N-acetyltransferase [Nocardioides sp. Y6]|uniref:GNAT family N-acetyltransferase n=1 Tax=Nocardioides malaquae TaxID=2773426 RepID=A0ABR9RP44_9ACTN|nr:GNAT family N-acetyltransferase [Nocardioides malaquae]MBE7323318.1 GNAT family N-acetyltransferase [Nocardioides malaquae]
MTLPTADVSVRIAWADDAPAIAATQVRAWRASLSDVVPAEHLPTDPADVAPAWQQALASPGDARRRALVALERNTVVGFVLTSPAEDPDCDPIAVGEMAELTLAPDVHGRGHGSRLLQAAVDTLAADGFTTAVTWVHSRDDALRGFLESAGWAADGAHRELALDEDAESGVRQVRLHTAIG